MRHRAGRCVGDVEHWANFTPIHDIGSEFACVAVAKYVIVANVQS
jgi:hypothetical protein